MSDGSTVTLPSKGEVILGKYIKPGFVHDFVLALRGTETTTLLSIWGALFAVSSVLQRRSWQDWEIMRLYPNLYLLFIARPGVCKKSTSILFGAKVIEDMKFVFDLDEDKEIYPLPLWTGSSTPEYMIEMLKPKTVMVGGDALGFERPFMIGSRMAVVADELSEFLGKQKYNQGMISRLTKLYDCPSVEKVGTKKDKTQEVRDVFINFFGGTTPDSFRDSIPAEAHGGGLMSRCVVVWQEHPTRRFYRPKRFDGAPDTDELARRLAWIAEHRMGEYHMSEEADALYFNWYEDHKSNLEAISDSDTRSDTLLVKTAHLIAASRYERSQIITADDVQAAIELTEIALEQKHKVESELMVSNQWSENLQIVSKHLKRKGVVDRATLLRAVSYKMNADDVNQVLTALVESGTIAIELDGQSRRSPGRLTRETYIWGTTDGSEDDT
jgi:hypothetical protein